MIMYEMMQTTLLKNAKLLAGGEGLFREVSWFALDETYEIDGGFVFPGVFLLYNGKGQKYNLVEYAKRLRDTEAAGILLFDQKYLEEELSLATLTFFDEARLPLLAIRPQTTIMNFMRKGLGLLLVESDNRRYLEDWVYEACHSQGDVIYNDLIAEQLENSRNVRYYCVLVELRDAENVSSIQREVILRQAEGVLAQKLNVDLSKGGGKILSFIKENVLNAFISFCKDVPMIDIQKLMYAAVRDLRRRMSNYKWRVTVGSLVESIRDFKKSYLNAHRTVQLVEQLHVHEEISFYSEWYAHMLLIKTPKEDLEQLVHHMLEPIMNDQELMETLIDYLTFGESQKITAEHMFIHINTLKYRLQKISNLLACDLKNVNTRFRLRIAVTAYTYLKK